MKLVMFKLAITLLYLVLLNIIDRLGVFFISYTYSAFKLLLIFLCLNWGIEKMGMQNIVHKNSLYLLSTVIRYKINYIMISMRPAAASTKTRNSAYNYSIHYLIAHKIHIPKDYLINYKTESI